MKKINNGNNRSTIKLRVEIYSKKRLSEFRRNNEKSLIRFRLKRK